MKNLYYKFVSAQNYLESYQERYPHAPANQDKTEYLICGEGMLNEDQMNDYKKNNAGWQPQEETPL
ncbi:hypothetical protein P7F88_19300 [Vibrio hannami]|uniref:hypothetical protein n=1 Tax=Vibrio hannami TaxID=2717094 RepID=UPI00240FB883|nr:hypothetical protein [Vibrio hannami]MDG3088103.1 hypothetical protein [Vibrio hannami]